MAKKARNSGANSQHDDMVEVLGRFIEAHAANSTPPKDPTPGAGALPVPSIDGADNAHHVGGDGEDKTNGLKIALGAFGAENDGFSVYTKVDEPAPLTAEEEINRLTSEAQAGMQDWTFGGKEGLDGSELCRKIHGWYRSFLKEGFFPSEWRRVPIRMPRHIHLTLQRRDSRQLGYYRLGRSDTGTKFHININPNAVMRHELSDAVVAAVCSTKPTTFAKNWVAEKREAATTPGPSAISATLSVFPARRSARSKASLPTRSSIFGSRSMACPRSSTTRGRCSNHR